MKKLTFFAGLIFLFAASAFAQAPCTRHVEAAGKFSYCPPEGWVAEDETNNKYKAFSTPTEAKLNANINFREELTSVTNDAYATAVIKLVLSGTLDPKLKAMKVAAWTDFPTALNSKANRVVFESTYDGFAIRSIQYIFDIPGKKLVLTGTMRDDVDKNATEKIFDTVAKSVKLNP